MKDLCSRSAHSLCGMLLASFLVSGLAYGADDLVLKVVEPAMKRTPEMQMQSPLWSSSRIPLLAFELTDRSQKTFLGTSVFFDGQLRSSEVPGSSASRLGGIGGEPSRADSSVGWWPGRRDFTFIRHLDGVELMHYDGTVRRVPDLPPGEVLEASLTPDGLALILSISEGSVTKLVRVSLGGGGSVTLARSTEVLHSLVFSADGENLSAIATGRGTTKLMRLSTKRADQSSSKVYVGYELLSLAGVPGSEDLVAYAKPVGNQAVGYTLLALAPDAKEPRILAEGLYLPPGLAPAPAVSPRTGHVFVIKADPSGGNPVLRCDPSTGLGERLPLNTAGNQEVAVGSFSDESGMLVDWLAVIAIGDGSGDRVVNQLYVGPLGQWTGWR